MIPGGAEHDDYQSRRNGKQVLAMQDSATFGLHKTVNR